MWGLARLGVLVGSGLMAFGVVASCDATTCLDTGTCAPRDDASAEGSTTPNNNPDTGTGGIDASGKDSGVADAADAAIPGPFSVDPIAAQTLYVGQPATIPVVIKRTGPNENIAFTFAGVAETVVITPLNVAADGGAATIQIAVDALAPQGVFELVITATGETSGYVTTVKVPITIRDVAGAVDKSFGVAGRASAIASTSAGLRVFVGTDGRIYVAGRCLSSGLPVACVARLNADGSLDSGYSGIKQISAPKTATLDSQNRLVIAGGGTTPVVNRLTSAGAVEFPNNPIAGLGLPAKNAARLATGPDDSIYVTLDKDDFPAMLKLDALGRHVGAFRQAEGAKLTYGEFALLYGMHFAPNGNLSVVLFSRSVGGALTHLAVQLNPSTGSPLVAFGEKTFAGCFGVGNPPGGYSVFPDGRTLFTSVSGAPRECLLLVDAAGVAVTTFGQNGVDSVALKSRTDAEYAIAAMRNNTVVIRTDDELGVTRLLATSAPDSSFTTTNVGGRVFDIAEQPDGRILVLSLNGSDLVVTRLWN